MFARPSAPAALLLSWALATSCHAAAGDAPVRGPDGARASAGVDLHYEIAGTAVPSPIVFGDARGHRTAMVLDTGAEAHALLDWFARDAGVRARPSAIPGHDALGHEFAFSIAKRPRLSIDGWGRLARGAVAVAPAPPLLRDLGVGAILSPQLLATSAGAVLLDLDRRRLERVDWYSGTRVLASRGSALITVGHRTCRDSAAGLDTLGFVVGVILEHEVLLMGLDTGARLTTVFEGTPTATALEPRAVAAAAPTHGLVSSAPARVVKGAHVTVGAVERTIDVSIGPGPHDPACPYDGLLGMDFLRSCALLFAPDRMDGACTAPPAAAPASAAVPVLLP